MEMVLETQKTQSLDPFDARLITCKPLVDVRGTLQPLDFDSLPFVPKRIFTVTDVPPGTDRGGHGHRRGRQFLICLRGRVVVLLRNAVQAREVALCPDGTGMLINAGVWSRQTYATEDTVLLVLASDAYNPDDYFYDWNDNEKG